MSRSLQHRLFIGLTAAIVITGVIGCALAYLWAHDEAIEMQDSVLMQVAAFAATSPVRTSGPLDGVDAEAEVTVIEMGDATRGTDEDRQLSMLVDGFHDVSLRGHPVRMLVRTRSDGSKFAVAQGDGLRSEIASDTALRTLVPIAALIPCLLLVTAVVIRRSLRPLVRLARELDARRTDDVSPLAADGAPSEMQPFLGSINGLLKRMRGMIDDQRRFVADAAHELRTPITALSLQMENLSRQDVNSGAQDRLDALKKGMLRTRHLLEQLLALARQDSATSDRGWVVRLDNTAKDVVAELLPNASARRMDVGFTVVEPVTVAVDPVDISSLVRNLVVNAIKYAPDGGKVDLAVFMEGASAVFRVEDTGPGIPPQDLLRVYEPFFRGSQPSGDGSGLGLSIVRRIVSRHGGTMELQNSTAVGRSGLRATVRLPIAS